MQTVAQDTISCYKGFFVRGGYWRTPMVSSSGQKLALCIGLNYTLAPHMRLAGCVNDAKALGTELKKRGFETEVLVDEPPTDLRLLATPWGNRTRKASILQALRSLQSRTWRQRVSTVFVSYSGHGTYVRDANGDERDGRDEAIVPWDAEFAGVITDDELAAIFRGFHPRTRIFLLMDCCHSGSIIDLPYQWDGDQPDSRWNENSGRWPNAVMMLSGCRDSQYSADAYNVEGFVGACGALTACFLASLQQLPPPSGQAVPVAQSLFVETRRRLGRNAMEQVCNFSATQPQLYAEPLW